MIGFGNVLAATNHAILGARPDWALPRDVGHGSSKLADLPRQEAIDNGVRFGRTGSSLGRDSPGLFSSSYVLGYDKALSRLRALM
jgi:hypothetical protein